VDPDPGGQKRAKIRQKSKTINVICIKMFIVTLFLKKLTLFF
jgi:hypothetical protein